MSTTTKKGPEITIQLIKCNLCDNEMIHIGTQGIKVSCLTKSNCCNAHFKELKSWSYLQSDLVKILDKGREMI